MVNYIVYMYEALALLKILKKHCTDFINNKLKDDLMITNQADIPKFSSKRQHKATKT